MVTEITKATMHRIDQGKICALANAGWSVEAISLDVRCTENVVRTVTLDRVLYRRGKNDEQKGVDAVRLGRQRAARYCVCGNDFGYI